LNIQTDRSGFFAGADKVGTFLLTNFIWAAFSMTIIGIPFATLGLFAMMGQWVRGRQPELIRVFGGAIRSHWLKILIVTALDLIIGGLLYFNFSVFQFMNLTNMLSMLSLMMTISVGLTFIGVNIYIWSLIPLLSLSTKNTIKLGMILVFTYPFKSAFIVIMLMIPVIISLFLPQAFLLFVTVSTSAYIAVRGTWWILQLHFDEDEIEALMSDETNEHKPEEVV